MLIFSLLAATPAAAQPKASTVVLVSGTQCCATASDARLERLVALELSQTGMAVVSAFATAAGERERRIELGVIAEEKKARAALRLVRVDGDIVAELWMSRDVPGRALYWKLGVGKEHASEAPSLIAIRVAELMRSQLSDPSPDGRNTPIVETLGAATEAKPPVTDTPNAAAPSSPDLSLVGTVAVVGARSAPSVWPVASLALQWRLATPLALSAEAVTSLSDTHATVAANRADLAVSAFRVWATWRPFGPSWIIPELSLGAGALWLRSHGETSAELTAKRDGAWLGYLGVGVGAAVPLSHRAEVFISGRFGVVRPQVAVSFAGNPHDGLRSPVWETGLGLRVRLSP